ncbi:MAG: hypothetical protein JWN64_106 [Parcubacteria group bacterium]|nr:hypothetical protein [Parcubacteria group bacterium]
MPEQTTRKSRQKNTAVNRELSNGDRLSVIALLDALIGEAQVAGTSDLHMDPEGESVRIRFRCDGILEERYKFPQKIHAELLSRVRVLAGLRTDEHQLPQDGRFRFALSSHDWLDIRVSIMPTYHGGNVVLRLLSPRSESMTLEGLGFMDEHRVKIENTLTHPHGLILVTGPTGSGKTSSLYTFAKILNIPDRSLVSIEDPIEYSLPGVRQIETNHSAGLTFSTGLRAILRQDPDVLIVGEIRDRETAGLAINAALTGHLVLSTLHATDALTSIPRLLDLGVEPYLLASTVRLIIAQRLVRRICAECKVEHTPSLNEQHLLSEMLPANERIPQKLFKGVGCASCANGFKGRVGLYEVVEPRDLVPEVLFGDPEDIFGGSIGTPLGLHSLMLDGIRKAASGITTLSEVLRVCHAQ